MPAALLLDFDGLLYDSENPVFEAWRERYAQEGVPFPLTVWQDQVMGTPPGSSRFDPLANLERVTGKTFDADAERRRLIARYQAKLPHELLPGAGQLLAAARTAGVATAVVSSNHHQRIAEHLARAGSDHPFDAIISADGDVARGKPLPTLYLEALDALGVTADQAIAFEDSPNGVAAAKAAGLYTVAVPNRLTAGAPGLELADLTLGSLAEFDLADAVSARS